MPSFTKSYFTKRLPTSVFATFCVLLLLLGFLSIGALHFITREPQNTVFKSGPITKRVVSLTLDVAAPEDNSLLFKKEVLVAGQSSPGVVVLITSEFHDLSIEAKGDGSFSTLFPLEEGVNDITVAAFDKTGDQRSVKKTIYYSKEKL